MLPDPNEQPTISVRLAAAALGIGVTLAYAEARRYVDTDGAAGIPAIAIGSRIVCPTRAIRRLVGLDNFAPVATTLPLPDPEAQSTLTVREAATILGVSLAEATRLANQFIETDGFEGLPVVRVGLTRTVVVPNDDALRTYLGRDLTAASAA